MEYFYVACSTASLIAFVGYVFDRNGRFSPSTRVLVSTFVLLTLAFWIWFYFAPTNVVREAIDVRTVRVASFTDGVSRSDTAEGVLTIGGMSSGATVLLPPFSDAPTVTLMRKDHPDSRAPEIVEITPDKFTVRINNSDLNGEWIWRARGKLLRRLEQ